MYFCQDVDLMAWGAERVFLEAAFGHLMVVKEGGQDADGNGSWC